MEEYESELLEIEESIDKLHEKHLADPNGTLFRETMEFTQKWLEFLEKGQDLLDLPPEERIHFEKLARELLRGELNDPGREEDLRKMVRFRVLYEKAQKSATPSIQH